MRRSIISGILGYRSCGNQEAAPGAQTCYQRVQGSSITDFNGRAAFQHKGNSSLATASMDMQDAPFGLTPLYLYMGALRLELRNHPPQKH